MGAQFINMETIVKSSLLVCFLATFLITTPSVNASPKIRASKNPEVNEVMNEAPMMMSCYESIPCGWALYSNTGRQPFRRISTYTRNRLCSCDSGRRCVLTDNWQDRRAYVFHCRDRDRSSHMFPFQIANRSTTNRSDHLQS